MTGLKKTLLYILVICTLGYGSAWAYDGHAVEMDDVISVDTVVGAISAVSNSYTSNDQNAEQSPEKPTVASADCDHCCHISAHMMAIFMRSGYLCSMNQSSELQEVYETFVSFIISPDLRPPRV